MQGGELMYLKLGRQKGKEKNSPPKMGEEGGRRKDGEGEKKSATTWKTEVGGRKPPSQNHEGLPWPREGQLSSLQ